MSDADTKPARPRALAIELDRKNPMAPAEQPTTSEALSMLMRGPIPWHEDMQAKALPAGFEFHKFPGRPRKQNSVDARNANVKKLRVELLDRFAEQIRDASETLPTLTVARVKRSRRASGGGTRDAIQKAARQLQAAGIPHEHWVTAMLDGMVVYAGRTVKLDAPIHRDRRTVQKALKTLGF